MLAKNYSFSIKMSTRIKRLSFEMLYCKAKSKNAEYRKLSSFSKIQPIQKSNLTLPPTKCGDRVVAKVDDLRLEERVTRLCGGG